MAEELERRRAELREELRQLEAALAREGGEAGAAGLDLASSCSSEERFRLLVDFAPDAMVILDADTGRFVDVNEHACRLFGLTRSQLLEAGPVDLSPETQPDGTPSRDAAVAWIRETIQGKPAVFEWTHHDASGNAVPCEVRLVQLPHGDHRWLRGSIVDISDRKRADDERERLMKQLAQAQKLQAIGQLTGGVAHDFNNLLTVILSAIDMIQDNAEAVGQVREQAEQARTAAERCATLTQQLLAYARRQPLQPQDVNINRLLIGSESLLRRALGETIALETVLGGGLWTCKTDPAQLENVVLNLVLNARDAMPEGGRLTIETANTRLDRDYALEHDEVEPGQYVMLAVSDNGVGMDADVLEQAFEPFFTTKDVGQGTGLGLSMVYGFVKQSGGHIKIYTEPGEGTTVRIYLPRGTPEPVSTSGASHARPAEDVTDGDGRRVLVVEDEPLVRGLIVKGLESLGYRTVDASDTDAALEILHKTEDIALLLTDVILAGGTKGTDLAREAQRVRPGLPVLFMSGYAQSAVVHEGRLDPGVSLLQKPFTHRELALAVEEAVGTATGDG